MSEEFTVPDHLSDKNKSLWASIVPNRAKSPGRLALLTAGLEALDRADKAREAIAATCLTTKTERSGVTHVNPLVKIERESRQQFARIWGELNLAWDPRVDGKF